MWLNIGPNYPQKSFCNVNYKNQLPQQKHNITIFWNKEVIMNNEWKKVRLGDVVLFNPQESIKKGTIAKKIAMEKLTPFCREISEFEYANFSGGTKFKNGDTLMARITPCLENGKIAKVSILD